MSDEPDFTPLAADCRAFAEKQYVRLPEGGWRIRPELVQSVYGKIDTHYKTVLGKIFPLEEFFKDHEEAIPFIRQAGIIRARRWERGSESWTTLLEFDDGNIGLLRKDEDASSQPRWPLTLLFQPWWSVNHGLTNFEIMPFGFIPADYRNTVDPGMALGARLNKFLSRFPYEDQEACSIPPAPKSNGYLFLPDGTPCLFDPGEGGKVWYSSDEVETVNDLPPDQRRALYASHAAMFQETLEKAFGKPPFSYMAGDQTKLEHFFPIPPKLEAAIKAHQRAQMAVGPRPDGLEKSEP